MSNSICFPFHFEETKTCEILLHIHFSKLRENSEPWVSVQLWICDHRFLTPLFQHSCFPAGLCPVLPWLTHSWAGGCPSTVSNAKYTFKGASNESPLKFHPLCKVRGINAACHTGECFLGCVFIGKKN